MGGQTGPKTQGIMNGARDGVLFVDEAYRLTSVESTNDFGREAVETLMAAMNEPPGKAPVMIFAGYTQDMVRFMRINEGLYRRIGYTFNFTDYESRDLAQILDVITQNKGFKLDDSLVDDDRSELAALIEEHTIPQARKLMNGGLCERIFDAAKQTLDARDNPDCPSVVFSKDDIRTACLAIPAPPAHDDGPQKLCAPIAPPAGMHGPPPPPHEKLPELEHDDFSKASDTSKWWNIWFHIDRAEGIRQHGWGCFKTSTAAVSVRLDQREVHYTAAQKSASRSPIWQETRIVPYRGESLVEFVVSECGKFVGKAVVALNSASVFEGVLELRAMDKLAGHLFVSVGWQRLASATGAEFLRPSYSSAADVPFVAKAK